MHAAHTTSLCAWLQVVALKFIAKAKLGLAPGHSAAPGEAVGSPDLANLHREVAALLKVRRPLGYPTGLGVFTADFSLQASFRFVNRRVRLHSWAQVSAHKHVTAIKDVIWDCDLPNKHGAGSKSMVMIAMELAEGGELFDYLMYTGPFSEAVARVFFRQLVSGTCCALTTT